MYWGGGGGCGGGGGGGGFFFQAEDGIRDRLVTGVQTCALPIFDRQDDFIVDGSGLFGGQHTPAVQPNMWLSTGNGFGGIDPDPSVTFDLGAVYTITSFQDRKSVV